jgi:NADH-quinone oxidoreductase subunit M
MNTFPWLTVLTLIPLVGGALVIGLDGPRRGLARGLGLAFMFLALGVAAALWMTFDGSSGLPQFLERRDWIPSVNVQYHLGVDGLGLLMVLLAALVLPFALLASGDTGPNTRVYVALMLFLEAGLFGSFTALNFIHWFLFWELSLIPAYFLIKLWGGPSRSAAANQFFIYTMVGSVTLLLSMLAVYVVTGTFDLLELAKKGRSGELESLFNLKIAGLYGFSPRTLALLIFGGAFLGFAVKVPVWRRPMRRRRRVSRWC